MLTPSIYHPPCLLAKRLLAPLLAVAILVSPAFSRADNISAGKAKAQSCAMCHGALGIAQMPTAPHLAGQPAPYLVQQLKDFRSGKRHSEIMNVIAKPMSDADIADISAWYASLKIEVKDN